MLYAHALESIFVFASLVELARLLCVSRSWQAAVSSMQPIGAPLPRNPCVSLSHSRYHTRQDEERERQRMHTDCAYIARVCASRLRRHVIHVGGEDYHFDRLLLTEEQLHMLPDALPRLVHLRVWVHSDGAVPLRFPPRLRILHLHLRGGMVERATALDATFACLAHLPHLEELTVAEDRLAGSSLHPSASHGVHAAAHVAMHHSLKDLTIMDSRCLSLDFLAAFPKLHRLTLSNVKQPDGAALPLTSLQRCFHLHSLTVLDGMAPAPSMLPFALDYLELHGCSYLPSLSFLSSSAWPHVLTHLEVRSVKPRLPLSELEHIMELWRLERLVLVNVFQAEPTLEQLAAFQPPSRHFRFMQTFRYV